MEGMREKEVEETTAEHTQDKIASNRRPKRRERRRRDDRRMQPVSEGACPWTKIKNFEATFCSQEHDHDEQFQVWWR